MKALLYKEFTLAMHPICYIFTVLFPFMILIPSYPISIGFIYVLTCYPILFLGANKGQQSNDLLFSTLLPVRKKDIVLARMITVISIQLIFIAITCILFPIAKITHQAPIANSGDMPQAVSLSGVGIGLNGFVSNLAIVLIGYAIVDLIYFAIYYKKGKSIVMSTLLTILGFVLYIGIFTIIIPYIPGCEGYKTFLENPKIWIQFILLLASVLIYVAIHIVVYKVSSKELEKVDF